MKKLNLNCIIKVKLTDYGKDIFYHQYDELNRAYGQTINKPRFPDVDAEGYSEFPLWNFMHLYGKHMMLAAPEVVVKPLNIYIKDEDLRNDYE